MSYLIDTNLISELRKGSRCDRNVASWFAEVSEDELFLSVLTIGELRRGIELVGRRDKASAASLNRWLRTLIDTSSERILNVDRTVAEEWGHMNSPHPLPVIDSLIAATARVHGLTVVTRNARDISRAGIACINPFVK